MGSEIWAEIRKFRKAIRKMENSSSDSPNKTIWWESASRSSIGTTPTSFQPV
jgi:hypothetical protein